MGNSNSSLSGYEIGAIINDKSEYFWSLYSATKKNDNKIDDEVTLFKFINTPRYLVPAQRHIQKLKTVKHPYILTYIESSISEDSLLLITESCVPLESWISNQKSNVLENNSLMNELFYGFSCLLKGLDFLHTKCQLIHNNICPQTILITSNGDWKLGGFDIITSINNIEDDGFLMQYNEIQSTNYRPKERNIQTFKVSTSSDIYSLSQVILMLLNEFGLIDSITESFHRLLKKMNSTESTRRPSTGAILKSPEFSSEYIKLLTSLDDFALKSPLETIDTFNKIFDSLHNISASVFQHKVLQALLQKLQMAVTDFGNRDSREHSRQIIQAGINVINSYAEANKVDDKTFCNKCVSLFNDLWTMSDRSIRSSLLKATKNLMPLTPATVVNKNIFDALMTGFNDSNAKMREETLKNLIYVVDKLDEKHLQERLVRCISTLQNDAENSIRTNATIFLGRIATKLKDSTRSRVLCPAFSKAMRDGFVHCRVAGLKAAIACKDLIDINQLVTILLPQVCLLLIDKNQEVRQLSITFIENNLDIIKLNHEKLLKLSISSNEHNNDELNSNQTTNSNSGKLSNSSAGWTTWAVDGLSKTLDIVVLDNKSVSKNNNSKSTDNIQSTNIPTSITVNERQEDVPKRTSSLTFSEEDNNILVDEWNDDNDLNWSDDEAPKINVLTANVSSSKDIIQSNDLNNKLTVKSSKVKENSTNLNNSFSISNDLDGNSSNNNILKLSKKTSINATPKQKPLRLIAKKIETKPDDDNWDDF